MKTYSAKPSDVTRKWYIVDASQAPLGRLSTQIATLLTGKGKPMFTQHIDCGDNVIVINAGCVVVTGDKMTDKKYYSYSGFPGGLSERSMREQMDKNPVLIIEKAVKGMLPVNKLRPARLARLKVYVDDNHNHAAQKPELINLKKGTK